MGTLLTINSCKKETTEAKPDPVIPNVPTTPEGMVKIGETYIIGSHAKAYVYAKQNLFVGYNTLYIAMHDSTDGKRLTDGLFSLSAEMDMGAMKHACPIEENQFIDSNSLMYSSSLVFIMPNVDLEKWTLKIGYHNNKNNKNGEGILNINVVEANPTRMFSGVLPLDNNAQVFVSFVLPSKAKIGLNDAEFTIHKKASNTNFPAVNNYSIVMLPTMPSMGHGSPNNVSPVLTSNGHYKGKVNFTMTGLWKIQLKLYQDTVLLADQIFFDIVL